MSQMHFEIIVYTGERAGTAIPVPPGGMVVGRGAAVELPLEDPNVSLRHMSFERRGDELIARDLGSSNGTFVAGEPITSTPVEDGALVVVGGTLLQVRASRSPSQVGASATQTEVSAPRILALIVARATRADLQSAVLADLYHLGVAAAAEESPGRVMEHGMRLMGTALDCETVLGAWLDGESLRRADGSLADPLLTAAIGVGEPERRKSGDRAALFIPIGTPSEIVGSMVAIARPGEMYEESALPLAHAIARHVGEAVHRVLRTLSERGQRDRLVIDLSATARKLSETRVHLEQTMEQLVEAERLVAAAKIAAGLVHEIANPLATLSANVDALRTRLGDAPADVREVLLDLAEGTRRMGTVVTKLRAVQASPIRRTEPLQLSSILEDVRARIVDQLGDQVDVSVHCSDDVEVQGDWAAVSQAVSGMIQYAAHEAVRAGSGAAVVLVTARREGDAVRLRVSYPGVLVPEQEREKLFAPFAEPSFGSPTGMELWICRRIASDHGGALEYGSHAGRPSLLARFPAA